MATPDLVEPIIAWRQWRVDGIRLKSLGNFQTDPWIPRQPAVAEGLLQGYATAGLYALKHPPIIAFASPGWGVVVGRVALWGVVHEHEHGYRAQYAYPISFARMRGRVDMRALCAAYGVKQEKRFWLKRCTSFVAFAVSLGLLLILVSIAIRVALYIS